MAEAMDPAVARWSPALRRARRDRTRAERAGGAPPEILEERRDRDGALRGPYETQYSIARGYLAKREIVRP